MILETQPFEEGDFSFPLSNRRYFIHLWKSPFEDVFAMKKKRWFLIFILVSGSVTFTLVRLPWWTCQVPGELFTLPLKLLNLRSNKLMNLPCLGLEGCGCCCCCCCWQWNKFSWEYSECPHHRMSLKRAGCRKVSVWGGHSWVLQTFFCDD